MLERLRRTARSRGYPADDATLRRLVAYLEAVVDANRRVNLTGARTLDAAVDVLALSALAVTRAWASEQPPSRIVDLGTGNGLPGVAAALAWPDAHVLLVERRGKKAAAVAACLARVGVENAEALSLDARDLLRQRPDLSGTIDLVTVRAVGPLAETVRVAAPWLASGGRIAHWKGSRLDDGERQDGKRAAAAAGLRLLDELTFADEAGPARLLRYARG